MRNKRYSRNSGRTLGESTDKGYGKESMRSGDYAIGQGASRVDVETIGYLKGSFAAWKQAGNDFDTLSSVSANTFAEAFAKEKAPVFDVRKNGEYRSEHLENAQNTPLDFINQHLPDFPKKGVFYLHCAGGYRSVIAGAILKKRGIHNLINVEGGFKAIKETDLPLTDYLCPSTF